MAINYEEKEFGKTGRGVEGEKYKAKQLTEDSVSSESVDALLADAMKVLEDSGNSGSLPVLAEAVRVGFNKLFKQLAGGTDEISKLARNIVKNGLGGGKSASEIDALIRAGKLFA